MSRFMLDTNIVDRLVKGDPMVARSLEANATSEICLSAISAGEIRFGLARNPNARRLHHLVGSFLDRVDVLPWDDAVAVRYGDLRASLESRGRVLGRLDMLIAAHALQAKAVLVTSDRSFRLVDGLTIQDWTEQGA